MANIAPVKLEGTAPISHLASGELAIGENGAIYVNGDARKCFVFYHSHNVPRIRGNVRGMKSNPKTQDEYSAFEGLLKRVIQVPHSEIKAELDKQKQEKKEKRPKASDASHASPAKD